jgi:hypothetical protein
VSRKEDLGWPASALVGAGFSFIRRAPLARSVSFSSAGGHGNIWLERRAAAPDPRFATRRLAEFSNYTQRGISPPGRAEMSTLTPTDRAAIAKRMKALDAKIQGPRLLMAQINDLQKERTLLSQRLNQDWRHAGKATSPQRLPTVRPVSPA